MALFLLAWQPFAQAGDTGGDPDSREEEAGRVDIKPYYPSPADKDYLHEGPDDDPGWYVNVNWDDDDKDGWDPNDRTPGAQYTPDKGDSLVSGNGCTQDDDLWKFTVEVDPASIHGPIRLTFDESKVKVYRNRNKQNPFGSGSTVNFTGQPIPLYLEGIAGTDDFMEVCMRGEYRGATPNVDDDTIHITVFEVALKGFFGREGAGDGAPYVDSQQSDNEKKLSNFVPGSNNRTGIISWDDANADGQKGDLDTECLYFGNCMEMQGTVKPSGVTAKHATFDFFRALRDKSWTKPTANDDWIIVSPTHDWLSDEGSGNHDEDNTPSDKDHIYQIDGPGCGTRDRLIDYRFRVLNFREEVGVILYGSSRYRCSNWGRWHAKYYIVPKDQDYITRGGMEHQALGAGWIPWPDTPPDP